MIVETYKHENIFKTQAQTLVCPVNTVGVMGAGLAKQFARRVSGLLLAYQRACRNKELTIKSLWTYSFGKNRKVLCFPTKIDWRNDSDIDWVEGNLKRLAEEYEYLEITSLAIPPVGCGKGNLDWGDVKPLVIKYLDPLPIPVYVYED